jgi:N-acetylneuraminate synthase
MNTLFEINNRRVGPHEPVYIVAEMSANHNHNYEQAVQILEATKEAGADAIKLQTYTPDTLTIRCEKEYFFLDSNSSWSGRNLYDLYQEAYTPWEWQPKLKAVAEELGLGLFSTAFDATSVDFLEKMNVPAYKIASFEIVDHPLIKRVAQTGKPIIMSTGMATLAEIDEAVRIIRETGNNQIALLKCTSAYPARAEEMNLKTIPHLSEAFNLPIGLSDHTMGSAVAVAAVSLGACIIEKHLTLSRSVPGPDSSFSLEPHEFKEMVEAVRTAHKALGEVHYGVAGKEAEIRFFRRSLFVIKDMKAGDQFTHDNVRSIRPGHGIHTRYIDEVIGRVASRDIQRGTPLTLELMSGRASSQ